MPVTSMNGRKLIEGPDMAAGASPRLRMAGPEYCAASGIAEANTAKNRFKITSPETTPQLRPDVATQSLTRFCSACQACEIKHRHWICTETWHLGSTETSVGLAFTIKLTHS